MADFGRDLIQPRTVVHRASRKIPTTCPVCRKELAGHLQRHLRLHWARQPMPDTGQQHHSCLHATRHTASGDGQQWFTCPICVSQFLTLKGVKIHTKRVHKRKIDGVVEAGQDVRGDPSTLRSPPPTVPFWSLCSTSPPQWVRLPTPFSPAPSSSSSVVLYSSSSLFSSSPASSSSSSPLITSSPPPWRTFASSSPPPSRSSLSWLSAPPSSAPLSSPAPPLPSLRPLLDDLLRDESLRKFRRAQKRSAALERVAAADRTCTSGVRTHGRDVLDGGPSAAGRVRRAAEAAGSAAASARDADGRVGSASSWTSCWARRCALCYGCYGDDSEWRPACYRCIVCPVGS